MTLFVTATGTEIGKTWVSCAILRALRGQGTPPRALKPVMSGFDPADLAASDAGALLAALGAEISADSVAAIAPWRFAAPLSPDAAAAREGRSVDVEALIAFCRVAMTEPGPLLIEGVGGAMVPLDTASTVRDWISALGIPALLVTGAYLGTISHTLCAVEALRARHVPIAAIAVNAMAPPPMPVAETIATIARHLADATIPVVDAAAADWPALVPLRPG